MLNCGSEHEPETHTLLHLYHQRAQGQISHEDQKLVLEARDVWLWLEIESNWMLGFVLEALI